MTNATTWTPEAVRRLGLTTDGSILGIGADPDVVAEWIKATQAERVSAQAQLVPRQRRAPGQRMSRAEIEDLVGRLGEIVITLRNADPRDKAEVYQHLGLYLRFDPGRNRIRAEARIGSTGGDMVRVGGATHTAAQRFRPPDTTLVLPWSSVA